MPLTPSTAWKTAAAAGTAQPALLFEFRPTALYDEKSFRGDWAEGSSVSNLDLEHTTDELRLAGADIESAEKQLSQSNLGLLLSTVEQTGYNLRGQRATRTLNYPVTFVQIVSFEQSFRLKKLYLGMYNRDGKSNCTFSVQLLTDFRDLRTAIGPTDNVWLRARTEIPSEIAGILGDATVLAEGPVDFSLDGLSEAQGGPVEGEDYETDSAGRPWRILDFSAENIWMPGGNTPVAIVVKLTNPEGVKDAELRGSTTRTSYSKGNFYKFEVESALFQELDACLAFRFAGFGYAASGSGIWTFDAGETPGSEMSGELELRYVEPVGTSLRIELREAATQAALTAATWKRVSDGAALTQRWAQLRLTFSSGAARLDTPRVLSLRAAWHESHKFCLSDFPLFGYPAVVSEPPDYSTEGDPLAGEAQASDTSRIGMLDPGGMVSRLFSQFNLKNDELRITLGFAGVEMLESEFLPFKTLWIEDWEFSSGAVTVHCYDQQVRVKEIEVPNVATPPEETEHIRHDLVSPAAIKRDLLRRARIRPSRIDNGSLLALAAAFDWTLTHAIEEPTKAQDVIRDLNQHLAGFDLVDESGKWRTAWIDFAAEPDPDVAYLTGDDILEGSEVFAPGRKHLKNVVTVLYGGTGDNDTEYRGLEVAYDRESEQDNKEFSAEKIHSEFIPLSQQAVAQSVAHARLNLQRNGLRTVSWETKLQRAYLRIGDHILLDSTLYSRPGVDSPNPLLVLVTRKSIDRNLQKISWTGYVLLDYEEALATAPVVAPPTGVTVTADDAGGVTWTWTRSADDTGAVGQYYRLYQRLAYLEDWGPRKLELDATGAATYSLPDADFLELAAFDFGVQFVAGYGAESPIVTVQDRLVTCAALAAPSAALLRVDGNVGSFDVYLSADVAGAHHYNFYAQYDAARGYACFGSISSGMERSKAAFYTLPNNASVQPGGLVWFRFTVVDAWGQESTPSASKAASWIPFTNNSAELAAPGTPSAPSLDAAGGTYPLITHIATGTYQGHALTVKIVPAEGEADEIEHYELERRDDGGTSKSNWGAWLRLPDFAVKQSFLGQPAAAAQYYENRDVQLKPGRYYQYRVRAVGKNGLVSAWSDSLEKLLAEDTTGPDQPVVYVTSRTLCNYCYISDPTQGGGAPCPDFSHYKIEGSHDGGAWGVLADHYAANLFTHHLTLADLGQSWSYRATAYDTSGNASTVSSASSGLSPQLLTASALAFTPVGSDNVIGVINASTEGGGTLQISAAKVAISGSTDFIAAKLDAAGGSYNSAASGARVQIFPDGSTGIVCLASDGSTEVFRVNVGGTDVGDVILGNYSGGQGAKWDQSAGQFLLSGLLAASAGIKTSTGNERIEIGNFDSLQAVRLFYSDIQVGRLAAAAGYPDLYFNNSGKTESMALRESGLSLYGGGNGSGAYFGRAYLGLYGGTGYSVLELNTNLGGVGLSAKYDSISIYGNQVVGARGAAIADATDATSTMNRLNDLLAFFRGWGSIAT